MLIMVKTILKPCPCCGISRSANYMEIQRLFGWEITLFCPHYGCDFEATGRGITRRGAERRAIKRWNKIADMRGADNG